MQEPNFIVLFRCDASHEIGSGHVMRCLTLAKELFNQGVTCVFLTNEGGKQVIERFSTCPISIESRNQTMNELDQLKMVIEHYKISYMIWDSYAIQVEQERIVSTYIQLMIIDDIYLLPSYSCDAILNQNIYAKTECYTMFNAHTTVLAGSRYAMLRESFRKYINRTKGISPKAKKILVTFGGSDSDNLTLKCLEFFKGFRDCSLEVNVVLGSHYAFEESIQNFVQDNTCHNIRLYKNVTDMAELMWEQDFAVTASGSTMYELAFLGVPSCCIVTADNQREVARSFTEQGAVIYGGEMNQLTEQNFLHQFRDIINDDSARHLMSVAGRRLIDGNGASRLADYIRTRMNERVCG